MCEAVVEHPLIRCLGYRGLIMPVKNSSALGIYGKGAKLEFRL